MSQPIFPELKKHADKALGLVSSGREQITMAGPAGCGKTRAIKHIVDTYPGDVCVAAYMGQAARMLQQRDIPATTIHNLLFYPADKKRAEIARLSKKIEALESGGENGKQLRALHLKLSKLTRPGFVINHNSALSDADFCIIDDALMVDTEIGEVLEEFGRPLLLVGDPYQLQPVHGPSYFDLSDADIQLTKIYRQDEGNGILELATAIREKARRPEALPDVLVRKRAKMNTTIRASGSCGETALFARRIIRVVLSTEWC